MHANCTQIFRSTVEGSIVSVLSFQAYAKVHFRVFVRIRTCVSCFTHMRISVYFRFPVIWLVLFYLLMVRFSQMPVFRIIVL